MSGANPSIGASTTTDAVPYGVTDRGFLVKPFKAILDDAFARARLVFGPDVDLRSSSAIRKVIELGCLETAVLWMTLDDVHHSGFTSTASGDALDLLGADLGLARARSPSAGVATFQLSPSAPPNCVLTMPPGTLVETSGPPPVLFRLATVLVLSNIPNQPIPPQADAAVSAVAPGLSGNIAAKQLSRLNPTFAARYLSFDPGFIAVSNAQPFSGGEGSEDDDAYRRKLQGQPRTFWTADAIRATVLGLDGVRDALVSDPYGGADTTAPPFGGFCFGESVFQNERDLCNPSVLTVVAASRPGVSWETEGTAPNQILGLHDQILQALEPIRPISAFPTIVQGDTVEVALRARVLLQSGADADRVLAAGRQGVAAYISSLRLGDSVLYAQVLRILTELPGVKDVQGLRLRRAPSRFGEVVFGPPVVFADPDDVGQLEASCGGNLTLASREVAVFAADSKLMDVEVQTS